MSTLPPVRRQVVVPGTAEAAFTVFTTEIGLWWPLGEHSVYGSGGTVGFRDGQLVERAPDGSESLWGTVLDWDPPHRLRITWHPASDEAKASEVEVRFDEVAEGQTLVSLEHRGWEVYPDPVAARDEYNHGWPPVLGEYADRVGGAGSADRVGGAGSADRVGGAGTADRAGAGADSPARPDGTVWLALMHTAGPALPPGEVVFTQPDFAEHVAFLRRLDERGVLVAAGSLDRRSSGMAVIRVPATEAVTYTRLAQDDDLSVVRGLLQVRVQPWHVALEGAAGS